MFILTSSKTMKSIENQDTARPRCYRHNTIWHGDAKGEKMDSAFGETPVFFSLGGPHALLYRSDAFHLCVIADFMMFFWPTNFAWLHYS